jgi:mannose-6-phosphate isomerase-like protein (cupin superfamily)
MKVTRYKKTKKVWGEEHEIVNCDLYCGKELVLKKQFRCSIHKHFVKDETFFLLKGLIFLEIKRDEDSQIEEFLLIPGDVFRLNPGVYHRFTGLKNSKFIEFSTKHSDDDSYRLTESEKMKDDEFLELRSKYDS